MGGNHGRDSEMTEKEEEKARSSVRSRASTRVDRAHRSAPVLISITLMAQTYIAPLGKASAIWPVYPSHAIAFPEILLDVAALQCPAVVPTAALICCNSDQIPVHCGITTIEQCLFNTTCQPSQREQCTG
ncbi:hypothetical protein Q5P01_018141 [Channa striata]|uniref:Uncharacterized protein n=1 Tax=Channa striata TaxID=64152 RepID=A0AA88S7T1_CHASR|nr:hypothetical protein Q5P01_018141 [Channa striata]